MMARFAKSKSWNLDTNSSREGRVSSSIGGTTGLKKFRLLLWKNYKIHTRHHVQTVVELLFPLLFTTVLVIVRNVVHPDYINEPTIYDPFDIKGASPLVVRKKCNEIFYTPKNEIIDKLMEKVRIDFFVSPTDGLNYTFKGFNSEVDLVTSYMNSAAKQGSSLETSADFETTSPILGAVVFTNAFPQKGLPRKIEYSLRFPASQRSSFDLISERFGIKPAWFTELIYPLFQLLGPRSPQQPTGGLPGYYQEGFLYLQYAIDTTLSRELLGEEELKEYETFDIRLQRFPYPPYIDDKYLFALQAWLPLITMLSFIYPVINITKSVVHEKERRLKESMKMMGLSNWLHWSAWFAKSFAFLLISILVMTILIKVKLVANLAILSESDGTIIFFLYLIFVFSVICFAFFVSALFSAANSGATAAGVLWFISFVPYFFLQPRYNLLSRAFKIACCLFTNVPIAFACQIMCQFEGTGAGLQWGTIFQGSSPDDNFSMGDCFVMMAFNGVFYMVSAIYIETVWPGEFGVSLPWYFPFTKWYWTGEQRMETMINNVSPESNPVKVQSVYFEAEPTNLRTGIEIKGLTKKFGKKAAVNEMNLRMYENQITALLGHNGAGKTTTMSILTGLFPPTHGTAVLNGYDISKDMKRVRSSLGLCPQHDVLFDELTVEEHLRFFCSMKGFPEELVKEEVDRMLESLGLQEKRHAQSHTLSGGMKRKLSVGIALCGRSKVVLLDEPTSGMDPGARRFTWDLIQTEKKGRTIVLSTHFMEEADLLGDRIAIMAEGEVQCCGSSLFLKKKYGGGYHLIIVKEHGCDVSLITDLLNQHLTDVEIDQNVGAELSYSLPDEDSHLFPVMFEELEKRRGELKIASYGASITTMEEVFIRVGREAELKGKEANSEEDGKWELKIPIENMNDSKSQLYDDDGMRNTGLTLIFQQLRGMIVKKFVYALRNRVLLLVQMGIPVIYLIIILIVLTTLPGLLDPPPHTLSLDRYERLGKTVTTIKCENNSTICQSYLKMVSKYYDTEEVSNNTTFIEYLLQQEMDDLVRVNFKYIIGYEERVNESTREIVGFFNNQPFHSPPLALNFLTNAILLNSTNHTVAVTNYPLPYSDLDSLKLTGTLYTVGFQVGYNIAFGMSFLAASFVVFLIKERESKSKHLQFVSGVEFPLFWTASFSVDMINYLIPCLGLNAVLILFQTEDFYDVRMQLYLFILLFFYGFAVIPFMYLWSYAFTIPSSGFTRMVLFNIFTGIATMLSVVILQIPELNLVSVADILNNVFLVFPNYALGMGIVQLSTNYQLTRQCSQFNLDFLCEAWEKSFCCAKLKSNYLDWTPSGIGRNIFYLLCMGCLSLGILLLAESKIITKLLSKDQKESVEEETEPEPDETQSVEVDSDVNTENARIRKTDLNKLFETDNLVLRDLTKYYNNFTAVDHINLGIKRGETFGLLGVNGAGKTTSFKMLTGDISVSKGDAFVHSYSVKNEIKKVHNNLGYCPQFDAIIDEMTGKETIRMYARLRGIPEAQIDNLADRLGKSLLFSKYIDKLVGGYSGGNKRKLSTAIALIGNPPIVFLDEPTTGMDPVARRHLWSAMSNVREGGTSIILTSHSMEECEALCSRLAIMVNGKFRCLGSPQQLKSKFGEGYTLIAQIAPKVHDSDGPFTRSKQELGRRRSSSIVLRKLKSAQKWETDLEGLRAFIEGAFPGCVLKDIHPGYVHYHVVNADVTWGQMFKTMEVAKEKFNLEAYSVGQTSLEQVFLNFTKAQINIELPGAKKPWRCCN